MYLALRSSVIALLSSLWLLTGCDMVGQMAESSAHATPIEAEIEGAAGKKPQVFSAGTGPILVVTVLFSEVPSLTVPDLEAIARAAIVREFQKEPTSLTISFVYQRSLYER